MRSPREEGAGSTKKHKARTPQATGGERKGVEGQEGASDRKCLTSVPKQPQSGALEVKGPIDIDTTYFLELKDGVRTKREFFISPSRVVDIGDWEASYNQQSLDTVHTQLIIDAMMMAFSQVDKTYELPTLKLAPLGLEKPKSGVWADHLKPEDRKDEITGQYYYYAVSSQHNSAAAKALLSTDVTLRYNFERWPARMVFFSGKEFEGYFLVSLEDNKKDLKFVNYENRPDTDWTRAYPFLKKWEAILVQFEKQGMNAALWDGRRKLVGDASLFKDCLPYMGYEADKTIKATEKLAQNKKLSADWKNKVLSVLTGSRAKSMEVTLAKGVVHVLWKDSGGVTSIAPFGVDPLEAHMRVTELEKAVGTTKCHTCVLDLRELVDFKQWTPKAFESLNSLLEQLFPSHWTVVAFVPLQWDYSFMTSLRHLPVVKAMAGKWVRRTQQKKSFPVGNNLYSADDLMYILFKGDDLRENTCVVYDARLSAGDAAAVGVHQKVTPTDISETPFDPCELSSAMPGVDRKIYKDMEWNPTQLAHLLEFVCKKGEGVMFISKPHARVVWEVLKSGRHVAALEGNSKLLQYTLEFLKSEVNSGASRCEFVSRSEKSTRVREPFTDMWFKLSERKRNRIYEFLFLETRPRRDNDDEYMRRKEHMLALLDNYLYASRKNAKNFLGRLECLYYVESEQVRKLESYGALISTEDEAETGVVFDTATPKEDSDREDIDIDYHPAPMFHASSAGRSTSQATVASPVLTFTPGKTPSKLAARLTPRPATPPPLRGGGDGGQNVVGQPTAMFGKGPVSNSRGIRTTSTEVPGVSGEPADHDEPKSARIRTSSERAPQARIIVPTGGVTHVGAEERAAGFDMVLGEFREWHGRDGGEEREEREEGEEGDEKGDINIEGDERLGNEEDADCEESSDLFGHLFAGHPGLDVDDDATTMEMETQVVSDLSADPENYEVQPLTVAVGLQHRCDEVSAAVSPAQRSE
ncbi:hypothetical protein CBR_g50789 [Chara braunii]|uniref:Uncharacterized protein n=1 Tax=Chara braunii TaxID=69332 RepID=A0A388K5X1_CHABU|nr:hypothetical protein CBR_g50789 [Chara braunii]|eukprot:GBG65429.1 hypothetical protein CBR_g50789 [Chara braunii]